MTSAPAEAILLDSRLGEKGRVEVSTVDFRTIQCVFEAVARRA